MPQTSIPYAAAKIHAIGTKLMDQAALERLASAQTLEETLKLLAEAGYPAETRKQAEEAAQNSVLEACRTLRTLSPLPQITDCFLYRYDALNLKSLLKARSLGLSQVALSSCGTVDEELMRHAVAEMNYKALPAFLSEAARAADKRNAEAFDPLSTDALVDRAVYGEIEKQLKGAKCPEVREYFACEADLINLLISLRAVAIGWSGDKCKDLFVPGGELTQKQLLACAADAATREKVIRGRKWQRTLLSLAEEKVDLPRLEKEADDYKMRLLQAHRHDALSILPLIGYVIAKQRESMAVRLILTARSSGVSRETLMERLRESYAR